MAPRTQRSGKPHRRPVRVRPHGIVVDACPEKTCFLALPFSADFQDLSRALERAAGRAGLEPFRTDERNHGPRFIDAISKKIRSARIVVADCSPDPGSNGLPNPNVLYELGLATAIGKPTLILTSAADMLPSDLEGRTYEAYSPDEVETKAFLHRLEALLLSTLDRLGGHLLTDPEDLPTIREIGPLVLLSLDRSDRVLDVLQFAKTAHHEFQAFDSGDLDPLRRKIERIAGSKKTLQAERGELAGVWRNAERYYRNQLERNLLVDFEDQCRDVKNWFRALGKTAQLGEQVILDRCIRSFGYLKTKIADYPQWMSAVEPLGRRLPDSLLAPGAAEGLCDVVGRLSDETKSIVVDADNLLLDLIELLLKRRAQ